MRLRRQIARVAHDYTPLLRIPVTQLLPYYRRPLSEGLLLGFACPRIACYGAIRRTTSSRVSPRCRRILRCPLRRRRIIGCRVWRNKGLLIIRSGCRLWSSYRSRRRIRRWGRSSGRRRISRRSRRCRLRRRFRSGRRSRRCRSRRRSSCRNGRRSSCAGRRRSICVGTCRGRCRGRCGGRRRSLVGFLWNLRSRRSLLHGAHGLLDRGCDHTTHGFDHLGWVDNRRVLSVGQRGRERHARCNHDGSYQSEACC
jgi:hypothetical protein